MKKEMLYNAGGVIAFATSKEDAAQRWHCAIKDVTLCEQQPGDIQIFHPKTDPMGVVGSEAMRAFCGAIAKGVEVVEAIALADEARDRQNANDQASGFPPMAAGDFEVSGEKVFYFSGSRTKYQLTIKKKRACLYSREVSDRSRLILTSDNIAEVKREFDPEEKDSEELFFSKGVYSKKFSSLKKGLEEFGGFYPEAKRVLENPFSRLPRNRKELFHAAIKALEENPERKENIDEVVTYDDNGYISLVECVFGDDPADTLMVRKQKSCWVFASYLEDNPVSLRMRGNGWELFQEKTATPAE
jgi:hypothetical protein